MVFTIFDFINAHLQKNRNLPTHHNWFLVNYCRLVNYKGPVFRIQSSKSCKLFPKDIALYYVYYFTKFHDQVVYDPKDMFNKVLYVMC